MNVSEDILRKIQKCLALASSPVPGEAEAAMRQAQKLMATQEMPAPRCEPTLEEYFHFPPATAPRTRWFDVATEPPVRTGWYEVVSLLPSTKRFWWDNVNKAFYFGPNELARKLWPVAFYEGAKWRGLYAQDELWTTRDGRRMYVGDMTEQHAKNTLRMVLQRNRRSRT